MSTVPRGVVRLPFDGLLGLDAGDADLPELAEVAGQGGRVTRAPPTAQVGT